MKTSALLALLAAIIVMGGSIGLQAQHVAGVDYVPGQVIVLVKESDLGDKEIENILQELSPVDIISIDKLHKYDLKTSTQNHGKRLFTLHFNENIDPHYVAERIAKHALVLIAEPNYIGYGVMIPSDPMFPEQWGLHNTGQNGGTPDADIDAPEAWDLEMGSPDIIISVIDTGADLDHEDLVDKLLPGYDFVNDDDDPEDDHGHGTFVTGIVGASTNNSVGIAGSCPNCMILPVRAGYNNGGQATFTSSYIFGALEYSINAQIEGIPYNPNPAKVISMSFSTAADIELILYGIQDAYASGAVLVAAAGNQGNNIPRYPAAYEEVIAVAATDENDAKTSFSNYGTWVDVAAPGIRIATTNLNNGYIYANQGLSGTSLSTPFVSGVAGLILSFNNQLTQEEVRQILINTSDPVTGFPQIEGGRVNAYQALLATPEPNMAPDLFPMDDVIVEETEIVVILAQAIDPNGDELNFSINSPRFYKMPLPPDGNIQQVQFVWYTGYEDEGIYEFEVSVTDGQLGDTEPVTVVVNNRPQDQGKPPPYEQYIPEQGY